MDKLANVAQDAKKRNTHISARDDNLVLGGKIKLLLLFDDDFMTLKGEFFNNDDGCC